RDSYISSRLAARHTDRGDGPPATIAFKCAAMQLGRGEAKRILGISVHEVDAEQERSLRQRSERLDRARKDLLSAVEALKGVCMTLR
ncbi:MAG: hypothetical protein LC777_07275, partial [Actinobacteria bacterium]|nr:hypothetical protein [Actinomycetota bacterium]